MRDYGQLKYTLSQFKEDVKATLVFSVISSFLIGGFVYFALNDLFFTLLVLISFLLMEIPFFAYVRHLLRCFSKENMAAIDKANEEAFEKTTNNALDREKHT